MYITEDPNTDNTFHNADVHHVQLPEWYIRTIVSREARKQAGKLALEWEKTGLTGAWKLRSFSDATQWSEEAEIRSFLTHPDVFVIQLKETEVVTRAQCLKCRIHWPSSYWSPPACSDFLPRSTW